MLSFSSVFSDARNFIVNNLMTIILVLGVLSIITQLITQFFYPAPKSIEPIQALIQQAAQQYGDISAQALTNIINQLSEYERNQLVPIAMGYLLRVGLVLFATSVLTTSCILSLIYNLSYRQLSANTFIQHIVRVLPQIILFILFAIPCFMALFIISSFIPTLAAPLMLATTVLYMFVYTLFLAVIIELNPQYNLVKRINIAIKFLRREIRLVLPMMMIWILTTILLGMLANILISNFVFDLIFNVIGLLINFMVICYFYRLYTLTNQVLPYDSSY